MNRSPGTSETPGRPWRPARPSAPVVPPVLAWALVVFVVLAQTMGLVHRVGHGPGQAAHASHAPHGNHGHAHATAHATAHAHPHGDTPPAGDWLHQLLSGHAAGSDCLGFDHAVVGDLIAAAPAWLAPVAAPDDTVPDAQRVWHLAAQAAGFLARGPPLLS